MHIDLKELKRAIEKLQTEHISKQEILILLDQFSAQKENSASVQDNNLKSDQDNLPEVEKEKSQIIQGSMIPTFVINNKHLITHWNRACEELTGHKASDLVGTDRQWVPFRSAKRPTMADVIVGGMSEEKVSYYYGTAWRRSSLVQGAYEAEEFFPHLGEEGKWIFFTAAPIKSPDGNMIGAIETLQDMTKNKNALEELELQDMELSRLYEKYKKSEEKYRSLFNYNPNPIFIIDRKTLEILDINHRVQEDYGFVKKELLGTSFLGIEKTVDTGFQKRLEDLAEDQSVLFTKRHHVKKDTTCFFVNVRVVNATYSHRDVLIASAADISKSIEKEEQLIHAGELAALGTLAAGMTREINEPLNVIQICSELILNRIKKGQKISDEELMEMINDMVENVKKISDAVNHLKDFSRKNGTA